jgi:hypothetical protein
MKYVWIVFDLNGEHIDGAKIVKVCGSRSCAIGHVNNIVKERYKNVMNIFRYTLKEKDNFVSWAIEHIENGEWIDYGESDYVAKRFDVE